MISVSFQIEKYLWTEHIKEKMRYYGLSEQRVKRVVRSPERKEEGIAPKTIAVMQRYGNKKTPKEIWVMYQQIGEQKRLISAWRYPGVSPLRQPPEIPDEVLDDLASFQM